MTGLRCDHCGMPGEDPRWLQGLMWVGLGLLWACLVVAAVLMVGFMALVAAWVLERGLLS